MKVLTRVLRQRCVYQDLCGGGRRGDINNSVVVFTIFDLLLWRYRKCLKSLRMYSNDCSLKKIRKKRNSKMFPAEKEKPIH